MEILGSRFLFHLPLQYRTLSIRQILFLDNFRIYRSTEIVGLIGFGNSAPSKNFKQKQIQGLLKRSDFIFNGSSIFEWHFRFNKTMATINYNIIYLSLWYKKILYNFLLYMCIYIEKNFTSFKKIIFRPITSCWFQKICIRNHLINCCKYTWKYFYQTFDMHN